MYPQPELTRITSNLGKLRVRKDPTLEEPVLSTPQPWLLAGRATKEAHLSYTESCGLYMCHVWDTGTAQDILFQSLCFLFIQGGRESGSAFTLFIHYSHPGSFPESCGCGGLEADFGDILVSAAGEALVRNSWKDTAC